MDSVKITSADWNGSTWDGPPFDRNPIWLLQALDEGRIAIQPGSEDYAWWRIITNAGTTVAGPGDSIECDLRTQSLSVRHADNSAKRRFKHLPGFVWPEPELA